MKNEITQMAKTLKAIANEKRLKVLYNILDEEMSVGEIELRVGLTQSALSQHLAVLRANDIVKTRRNAQTIFYALKDDRVRAILKFLLDVF
jgi:DNA-binding transcriptional ArsR family regulator